MIMDYLLMSYIALASCWPVTLILLSVAVVVLLHAERRVLNVSIVVWLVFWFCCGSSGRQCVAFSLLVGGAVNFVHPVGKESR